MDMLQMPVRLVVKAPNQQIEDQMVECALDWTVQKLKAYLSEAYPNKPKAEEQKLIYSGQLLHDHLMLKDFLRQYEAEKVHTVHLVCVPPRDAPVIKTSVNSNLPDVQQTTTTESCPQSVPSRDTAPNDGLRHRNGSREESHSFQQYTGIWPYPNTAPQHIPANLMTQQTAWIQQMYMHYMYLCMAQYQGALPAPTVLQASPENQSPVVNQNPQPEPEPDGNENEAVERRPANIRINAQGVAEDDDDDAPGNWDWLDWFYAISRATVLFSIVYFYSSFSRFALVMLFAALIYFFRRQANGIGRRVANNRPGARAPERLPRQNEQGENIGDNLGENEAEQMHREIREIVDLMNQDMDETNEAPNQGVFHQNTLWTFITTFFSSLLPEQPDQLI